MKVLFLNPHLTAEHNLVTQLQAKKFAVLLPSNAEEAWQMLALHGNSIDLVVIHREDQGSDNNERGLALLAKLKADPAYADLPVLVTSHRWGDGEFADHQGGPLGANAYLKWPFTIATLTGTIDAIFGHTPAVQPAASQGGFSIPTAEMVLEDASSLFSGGASTPSQSSIQLEAPDGAFEVSPEFSMEPAQSEPSIALPQFEHVPFEEISPVVEMVPTAIRPAMTSLAVELPDTGEDLEAAQEMPYLFTKEQGRGIDSSLIFAQPQGDAVVPGGAAHSPDMETLKKYLLLREQDVSALSSQQRSAREQLHSLEDQLREERARNAELSHIVNEQKRKLDEFEKEKQSALESVRREAEDMRFQVKTRADKARILESQVREAADEMGRLKERVRTDIRKIRVREKELENRLELMRKDSEALMAARESKIIELKRKLDLMEFNMDLLQDQHAREKENSTKLRDRLTKAAQVVRVAGGLLDSPGGALQLAAALEEEAS